MRGTHEAERSLMRAYSIPLRKSGAEGDLAFEATFAKHYHTKANEANCKGSTAGVWVSVLLAFNGLGPARGQFGHMGVSLCPMSGGRVPVQAAKKQKAIYGETR